MTYVQPEQVKLALGVVDGDWADPDWAMVEGTLEPPKALPLNHFGGWASWLAAFAASKSAPADYAAVALLASAATALGAAYAVSPWEGWQEYPALWILMVGDPSASKSPIFGPFVRVLIDLEREEVEAFAGSRRKYETDLEAAEESEKAWKAEVAKSVKANEPAPVKPPSAIKPIDPGSPRIVVSDATIESLAPSFKDNPRGLALWRDELSGWVGGFGKYGGDNDAPFFLERYTGEPLIVDRVKAGTVTAERALLSVFGGIQPDRFHSILAKRVDDGLVARFLFAFPGSVERARPRHLAPMSAVAQAMKRLRALGPNQRRETVEARTLPLSTAATGTFESWWKENGSASSSTAGFLSGMLGKGPGVVLRLALILELLKWSLSSGQPEPGAVGEDSLLAAIGLYEEYFVPMAERVFATAGRSPADASAMKLIRHIRKTGERVANVRDLQRKGIPSRMAVEVKAALEKLAEGGWVRFQGGREGDRKGAQRGDWAVNPLLWEKQP